MTNYRMSIASLGVLIVLIVACGKSEDKGGTDSGVGRSETGIAPSPGDTAPPINVVGYAYVANQYDNSISQYTIAESGALIPMTPHKVVAGETPADLAEGSCWKTVPSVPATA